MVHQQMKKRVSADVQGGPRLARMLRNDQPEEPMPADVKAFLIGLAIFSGGMALILFGVPIVAAVLGVR